MDWVQSIVESVAEEIANEHGQREEKSSQNIAYTVFLVGMSRPGLGPGPGLGLNGILLSALLLGGRK
jgi:hypothetical protein